MPSLVLRSRVVFGSDCEGLALGDALQLDVRADAVDAHVVGVEEVVAQIQLAEPQGYGEASEVWRLSGCAVERDVEVGPFCSDLVLGCGKVFSIAGHGDVQVDFFQAHLERRR